MCTQCVICPFQPVSLLYGTNQLSRLVRHHYPTEVDPEEGERGMVEYKEARLYNVGLIFHKVAKHHQEEISEIKDEIFSAHGQKPCRL